VKLRELMLENNVDIFFGANDVRIAKERVWVARASLLPQINLGVLATSMANPSFLLSSIEMTLPFIIPNNWFELFKQEALLKVDQAAFRIIQLNVYAQALALLHQVQADVRLREVLVEQLDYATSVEVYTSVAYRAGRATLDDWNLARAELAMARVRLEKVDDLLENEKASLRTVVDVPIGTSIVPAASRPKASRLEHLKLDDAAYEVNESSIELKQIEHLLKAAEQERFQKAFAFISGASVSQQVSAGDAAAGRSVKLDFGQATGRGLFTFGFDQFPNYNIANRNIDDIKIRRKEVRRENARVVEASLNRLVQANERHTAAVQAEGFQRSVLDNALVRYRLGTITLLDLILQQQRFRETSVERLQAESLQDQLRVTLQRVNLEGQFDEIQDCRHLDLSKAMGPWGEKSRMPKVACGLEKKVQ
jgi:outer membrane protein TolC